MAIEQKISPFLWFDHQAEAAAHYYTSIFPNSKIGKVVRNGEAVMVVDFSLNGQNFSALNGGPRFQFNPSISFFIVCETPEETQSTWDKLAESGNVLMPLDTYPWSERYGWVADKYGLTWQVMLGEVAQMGQKFVPSLLFSGPQQGNAEVAVNFYRSVFDPSASVETHRYGAERPGQEEWVMYAQWTMNGQVFTAMDNPLDDKYSFNEAISFVVSCETQAEVDFFWEKLTADGGEESMCGWLKDRFGVSWQIVPEALPRLLGDPDPAVAQTAMAAMLQMRKIIIADLSKVPEKTNITVETTIHAPIDKVWQHFTAPAHIEQWNAASDDWHCPKAINDLRTGGTFVFTMAARDGSVFFDFNGIYDEVVENQHIAYTTADGRKVEVEFRAEGGNTHVVETFEAENIHSHEMQRAGWQAILDNFKKHTEA
jgi:predicted 3-demethylubiquinone-9 3-methyltransferase (glyoxalase superfamily)/uncharacterized protein YndB with AHSA1/START domain